MRQAVVMIMLAAGLATSLGAQEPAVMAERRAVEQLVQTTTMARAAVETRVTTGSPYSAEAVNEFVQVLADGNRIVRKTTTRIYRDSEGRTRRETYNDNASTPSSIVITDPVAKSTVILNPDSRTGTRGPATFAAVAVGRGGTATATVSGGSGGAVAGGFGGGSGRGGTVTVVTQGDPPTTRALITEPATAGADAGARIAIEQRMNEASRVMPAVRGGQPATKEDLGQQTIEGVTATGTRWTTVIPAGAIGNEQPLTTVTEQWYSKDIEALVLTKHSDPRTGETTYRLSNIVRAEPDRSLFQAPADYTIRDTPVRRLPPGVQ